MHPTRAAGLLALAIFIGAGAGVGAAVLIWLIELVGDAAHWVSEAPMVGGEWMFLTIPVGMFLAWSLTAMFAPEVAGHGVPQIIAALTLRGGNIRARVVPLKTIATGLTIGSGGSAGREGSIAQIGAGLGSIVARVARLGEPEMRTLVAAGAGAGIAATFNAPIAGMFFAMEVILRDMSVRYLHTVVVASIAGAVVSHAIIGDAVTFRVSPYTMDDPWQLVLYLVLGFVAVGLAILFIKALDGTALIVPNLPSWLRPVLFGLIVAAVGFWLPEVLGTGQGFIGEVLRSEIDKTWWFFGLLALAKLFATSITLGGKGAGGIFMPSLFIGGTAGAALAAVFAQIWPRSALEPGAFALVGMAAMFAGVARAPLTSILIVFEVTGDYGLVLPLMLAVAISTYATNQLHPESAYTSPLKRMGIHIHQTNHVDLLSTVSVRDLELGTPDVASPDMTLGQVQGLLNHLGLSGMPVVDHERLVGVITRSDIGLAGGPSDQVTVGDAMTPNPVTVTPDIPVSETLDRMAALGVGRIPVVAVNNPYRVVAMFGRDDAVAAYHLALGMTPQPDNTRGPTRILRQDSSRFFEFDLSDGSPAVHRSIREVSWPEACLVVSINRGDDLLIATGDEVLQPGDILTVFGDENAERRLTERLRRDPGDT